MEHLKKRIYNMLKAFYRDGNIPTHSELIDMTKKLSSSLLNKLTDKEIQEIVDDYEINIGIKAFDPESIVSVNVNSEWLIEKKKEPSRQHLYWERYEDYLREEKDFDEDTISILKRSTEEILGYCANPTPKINEVKKRKGLVVGDVQSGKTANYMALINMACDYDYKLIIVLAGLTDSLRMQTQERVDEGFIGAISNTINSSNIKFVGVGSLKNERYAVTLTNLDNDFKRESMNAINNTSADYNKPVILVVKKNKSTLENVKTWLKPGANGVTDHILIIDDEADNASVNTKKIDELLKYTSLVMLDIKHINNDEHKKLTAHPNTSILDFAKYLSEKNVPTWIRHVVIPNITYKKEYLTQLGEFIAGLNNVKALDILPYHNMAIYKYENLDIEYPLKDILPLEKEDALNARNIIIESIKKNRTKKKDS